MSHSYHLFSLATKTHIPHRTCCSDEVGIPTKLHLNLWWMDYTIRINVVIGMVSTIIDRLSMKPSFTGIQCFIRDIPTVNRYLKIVVARVLEYCVVIVMAWEHDWDTREVINWVVVRWVYTPRPSPKTFEIIDFWLSLAG